MKRNLSERDSLCPSNPKSVRSLNSSPIFAKSLSSSSLLSKTSSLSSKNYAQSLIITRNIHNIRLPGMSEFQSATSLQNSTLNFSFSKTKRFQTPKANTKGLFYNLPSMRSTRAASIGYGKRKDFRAQESDSTVSPNAYHVDKYHEMNEKRKHLTIRKRVPPLQDTSRNNPGPGEYNIVHSSFMKDYPILIRSRRVFYYSNDIKNSNPSVSPQSYRPKLETVQETRFNKIGIGYGNKILPYNKDALKNPGVGTYNLHSIFDRKFYKKIPLN